ncbi:hypothetical protein [Anabaena azotica]|uniref:Uncharacterized protein n=1 Tax=Anabaena azotica FACHB-119 TaxID=947527 RepID=A0ABR8DHN3_9NOST|nr:hypothetical protein [Anabaena azotica]MBD2505596.1 hypothetical protein [Anabaena azotica FACHB-119]
MKVKYIVLSISGLLVALAFSYFASQILNPKITLFIGGGAVAAGAVLQVRQSRQQQSTIKANNNVPNL